MCFFFSFEEKVGISKYGRAHTFLHGLGQSNFMQAMRGPCQLISGGWWRLHPSPYVFFHPEIKSSWSISLIRQTQGTFPTAKTTDEWRAEPFKRNEIFRATQWHELDLPEKVMRYHGNREHHRYVKKVARRAMGVGRGCRNWIHGCGIQWVGVDAWWILKYSL